MPKPKLTGLHIAEAAQLREEAGWSIERLARRYNVSTSAMDWHLLRIGAEHPARVAQVLPQQARGPLVYVRAGREIRHFTPDEDTVIQKMAAEGRSNAEIGLTCKPPRAANSIRGRLLTLARHEARREAADEIDSGARDSGDGTRPSLVTTHVLPSVPRAGSGDRI
jgi:hypothetical protein